MPGARNATPAPIAIHFRNGRAEANAWARCGNRSFISVSWVPCSEQPARISFSGLEAAKRVRFQQSIRPFGLLNAPAISNAFCEIDNQKHNQHGSEHSISQHFGLLDRHGHSTTHF